MYIQMCLTKFDMVPLPWQNIHASKLLSAFSAFLTQQLAHKTHACVPDHILMSQLSTTASISPPGMHLRSVIHTCT